MLEMLLIITAVLALLLLGTVVAGHTKRELAPIRVEADQARDRDGGVRVGEGRYEEGRYEEDRSGKR